MKNVLDIFKKETQPLTPVNVEIDYKKLAEAIVKAQEIANEKESNKDDTSYFLKLVLCISFVTVAVFLLLIAGYSVHQLITQWSLLRIFERIAQICICVMALVYMAFSVKMIVDIKKIRDRSYLAAFFSAIVSLTALIVALVK